MSSPGTDLDGYALLVDPPLPPNTQALKKNDVKDYGLWRPTEVSSSKT